ncbi:MAG: hypothetical protein QOI08_4314, partial [Actinomycetota bacterium]|nr:hypothetical protein [Actinomycetota bacterium]
GVADRAMIRPVSNEVGREPQYESFADAFLDHAIDGFYNAHYDRPACLGLLGHLRGKRVLDAACGPGLYAADLVGRGATIVGFDQSQRMVGLARSRVAGGDFRVHDLGDPLDWIADATFDLALCALALEYVDDRVSALRELRRVIKPDGALVISRQHPTADWLHHGGSYFENRVIEETWSTGWHLRYWLNPLQQTTDEIFRAGFVIERLIEPRPTAEAQNRNPNDYEMLRTAPGFIAMRLIPHP